MCWECYPNEINRAGGAFEAGCSRVTADDIYAGWQSLTSGGTWIPDNLHFWIDDDIAGLGGGYDTRLGGRQIYVENAEKLVCDSTDVFARWKSAIDWAGEAPIEIEIDKIGDEIIDGALRILDDVETVAFTGTDCDKQNYILSYWDDDDNPIRSRQDSPYYNGRSGIWRWLGRVVSKLQRNYSCGMLYSGAPGAPPSPDPIDHDCPDREQHPEAEFMQGRNGQWHCDNDDFAASGHDNVTQGISSKCRNTPFTRGGDVGYHFIGTRFRTPERMSRLADHTINQGMGHSDTFFLGRTVNEWNSNACTCCQNCDQPLGDATFTINAPSDCWLINHLTGARIEDKKPLGGTFILPASQKMGCRWGADFPNSFIDHITMYQWSVDDGWGAKRQGLTVVLYHRGNIITSYELWDGDLISHNVGDPVTTTPVADWSCSGSITLPAGGGSLQRTAHGWDSHGFHVCDPCSWDEDENAFARFVLYSGDWEGRIDPDRLVTLNGAAITLTSTDGTIRTYTLKTDGSADPSLLEFNWDTARATRQEWHMPVQTIINLKSVVESASGHDGKIIVKISSSAYGDDGWQRDMLKFTQLVVGDAGNTDITYNLAFKDWCRLLPSYRWYENSGKYIDVKSCPDKFQGGEWCRGGYVDWNNVNHSYVNCFPFATHPSSWPHSCPCKDWQGACLPPTITVTI